MFLDRKAIKENAKQSLSFNYWPLIGWTALFVLIYGSISGFSSIPCFGIIFAVANIIVSPVIVVGLKYLYYKAYCREEIGPDQLFGGFKNYGHVLGGTLWQMLFIFLWALIPIAGIVIVVIKSISYSMTSYILMDQPDVDACSALKLSMAMTDGHKGEIFVMQLSFIGWGILSLITFGIVGIFYATPYQNLTYAGYYDALKELYAQQQGQSNPAQSI